MSVPGLDDLAAAVVALAATLVALLTLVVTIVWIPRVKRRGDAEAAKAVSDAAAAKASAAKAAIEAIAAAAMPAVLATEQVFAGPLRAAAPHPGELSTEQARLARESAIRLMTLTFGDGQIDAMLAAIGCNRAGLQEIMRTHVEAAKFTTSASPPAEYRLLVPRARDTVELTATDVVPQATDSGVGGEVLR